MPDAIEVFDQRFEGDRVVYSLRASHGRLMAAVLKEQCIEPSCAMSSFTYVTILRKLPDETEPRPINVPVCEYHQDFK